MPPHDALAALEVELNGMELILLGDLIVSIREPRDNKEDEPASALAGSKLGNMTDHFTPR